MRVRVTPQTRGSEHSIFILLTEVTLTDGVDSRKILYGSPRNFKRCMAQAGDLEERNIPYPRMQMLSVEEIFDGRRFNTPSVAGRGEPQPTLPGSLSYDG